MRSIVTFVSDAFRQQPNEDGEPYFLGEDVAAWLSATLSQDERLKSSSITEPFEEDWGWAILASLNGRRFLVGIGERPINNQPAWICFVNSTLPFYRKWFGACDDAERQSLCQSIHRALSSHAQIQHVRWHDEQDFMRGDEDSWRSTPD
jgi:hypothetical protein